MTTSPPPAAPAAALPPPPAVAARAGQQVGAPTPASPGSPASGAPAPAPAGGLQGRLASVEASVRAAMAGTPGRLRAVGIVSVVATLLFGLAAGQAFRSADGALGRAAANADQLVRIQAIQTNVVQADADATNAFLVGGLEPPAQRADYTGAIASASELIAQAAQHQPADGAALGALNQSLVTYTSQVEQARANNRQALPVGAQYLKSASADLRAEALPLLTNLGEANNARVTEEFDRAARAALWLVVAGVLALAVLVLSLVWLARRTRRYLNLPLVVATAGVLVVLVVGAFVMAGAQSRANDVRATSYTALRSLAEARIAANAAKSDASISFLYLRTGGSFATYKSDYDAKVLQVGQSLQRAGSAAPSDSTTDFVTWRKAADTIFTTDFTTRPDDWIKAANAMAKVDEPFNKPFLALDDALAHQIGTEADKVGTGLDDGRAPIVVLGWAALVVGLLAAVGSWAGIAQRLEDYR